MINDVRRAYFYIKIQRDVYIELPKEDPDYGKGSLGEIQTLALRHSRCSEWMAGSPELSFGECRIRMRMWTT